MMFQSKVFQDRLATLNVPDPHRKSFEAIWNISMPKKQNQFTSPLSRAQIKAARKSIQKRRKEELDQGRKPQTEIELIVEVTHKI